LTAAGRDAIDRLIPLAREITQETLAPLSAKEIATFMKLLVKLA
ncbi:MarR family transcriptional regulator, partial [Mesorhizobium sp. M7A.T.Ca.TU.009.02.1.1]